MQASQGHVLEYIDNDIIYKLLTRIDKSAGGSLAKLFISVHQGNLYYTLEGSGRGLDTDGMGGDKLKVKESNKHRSSINLMTTCNYHKDKKSKEESCN